MRGGDESSSEESITSDEESIESEESLSSFPEMDEMDDKEDNTIEIDYKLLDKPLEDDDSEQDSDVEQDSEQEEELEEELEEESEIDEDSDVEQEQELEELESEQELEQDVDEDSDINDVSEQEQQEQEELESDLEEELEEELEEDLEEEDEVRNIDGMKLNKPYYFQTLIEKKDPVLILKEDTKEFNSYSRTCLSDKRRQPVILTDTQLDKINKEHPGFLREQDVVKYGSDKKHQYNYICPRYWCLKNNTFIHPDEIHLVDGEYVHQPKKGPSCGKVLPKKEKNVKPGYYIYEFNDESYPGLIPGKHPDGLCLPCCFKNYNTQGRIKAKESCLKTKKDEPAKQPPVAKEEQYVLGPEKFPLEPNRWGYLPPQMEVMLRVINADCQISKTNSNIKDNHPCLLRHGIEVNKKQSFIAAISDILFYGKRIVGKHNIVTQTGVLNIEDMKKHIIQAINIDSFIHYQNGNLVLTFQNPYKKVDISKYKNTKLYNKLNMQKPEDISYFTKVISAFESFISFLKDDDVYIDHTYLWDILSSPNKYLFPNGVNLVIFKLPNDDITNNVQLLCPTNHYSNLFYESKKPTVILIYEDGYYEPIYSYLNSKNKLIVTKEFKEYDPTLSQTMRTIFKELIKPFFQLVCKPLESMPNIYKAKQPLLLTILIEHLLNYKYTILQLVMNFNNKIIGVVAQEPSSFKTNLTGFVPCYPSSYDSVKHIYDFVFMNDENIWHTYDDTMMFLTNLDNRSKKKRVEANIPCKPAFKIIEDGLVVGILTITNQFIQISQPIRVDEIRPIFQLPSIRDQDYVVNPNKTPMTQSDVVMNTSNDVDKERVDYIKKLKLETNFYNAFRNTIRNLLNDYQYIQFREKIEHEIQNPYILYSNKLENMNELLKSLVGNKIQFIGDKNYYKLIDEVSTCIVKDETQCQNTPNLCVFTEQNTCNLILPEYNLITSKKNENIYFGRMADELIRYKRIQSFMLQPQTYLLFGKVEYNLGPDEILLLQSLLTPDYFEKLIPSLTNKYIQFNTYDETQPQITQTYNNVFQPIQYEKNIEKSLIVDSDGDDDDNDGDDDGEQRKMVIMECDPDDNDHIVSGIWKKCFPKEYYETSYGKNHTCSFRLIIDLMKMKTNQDYDINEIKRILIEEYNIYYETYKDKILTIFSLEGKKKLSNQLKMNNVTLSDMIYMDNYYLTSFDLWLLVNKFNISTIFISQKMILLAHYQKHEFVAYGNIGDNFAFIVLPSVFKEEKIPNYKLVKDMNNHSNAFISVHKLNSGCVERIIHAISGIQTIETFLEKVDIANIQKPTKKKKFIIESDTESIGNKSDSKKGDRKLTSSSSVIILPKTGKKSKKKKKVLIKGEKLKNTTKKQKPRKFIIE